MTRRGHVLELAVLGLLQESPMHGYELRKRVNAVLGMFRALSYGTLYPCLKSLLVRGWIAEAGAGGGGEWKSCCGHWSLLRFRVGSCYELRTVRGEREESVFERWAGDFE